MRKLGFGSPRRMEFRRLIARVVLVIGVSSLFSIAQPAVAATSNSAACIPSSGYAFADPNPAVSPLAFYLHAETSWSGCTAPFLTATFTPLDVGTPYACSSSIDVADPTYFPSPLPCYEPQTDVIATTLGGYEVDAVFTAYYGGLTGSCALTLNLYAETSCRLW